MECAHGIQEGRAGAPAARLASSIEVVRPASLTRRMIAYLIDWYAGALCGALPVSAIAAALSGDIRDQSIVGFASPFGLIAGALGLLCAICYLLLIPVLVWPGQTPGKRLCAIRIACVDGTGASASRLAIRQIVGIIGIEGAVASASAILHQMLTILSGVNLVTPLMYVGFAITGLSAILMLARPDRRCLHDLIAGTRVISAR